MAEHLRQRKVLRRVFAKQSKYQRDAAPYRRPGSPQLGREMAEKETKGPVPGAERSTADQGKALVSFDVFAAAEVSRVTLE